MKTYIRSCEYCYQQFETDNLDEAYCSKECKKKQDAEDIEAINRLEED